MKIEIDNDLIDESFDKISDYLFNHSKLVSGIKNYRLTEIEFYYFNEEFHSDLYSHKHYLQQNNNTWYFHPSGLDITFGNQKSFGGILIRGLIDLDNKKNEIYGPLNVVTELFKNIYSIDNHQHQFGLVEQNLEKERIIKAKRIGLGKEKSPKYYDKLYRHLIYPDKKHKNKFDYDF